MPSFDIVSRIDLQEVDNAINLVIREIGNRYDFKSVKWSIENDKTNKKVIVNADSEYCLEQIQGSLKGAFVKRSLDPKALTFKTPERASGNTLRQTITVKEGIDQDNAKKITKTIKDKKMKVQASIQGDELRIVGKKRDDLQEVMTLAKTLDLEVPLQYVNFRD